MRKAQAAALEELFRDAPEPEAARARFESWLGSTGSRIAGELLEFVFGDRRRAAWVLTAVFGHAPFFSRFFSRHPEKLLALFGEELESPRTASDFRRRLDRELESDEEPLPTLLRRFKYFELARTTVRECSPELVPPEREPEVLSELTGLAECVLGAALEHAFREQGLESTEGFCVLGLGKLGGGELNYSSDVDLVYVAERSDTELRTRAAQSFGRILAQVTEEGFLYRVDLDLRPQGRRGPLVVSVDALLEYFESWAATWEKAAYMKARPVAGDEQLGWKALRALEPVLYRSSMDFGGVAAIREWKEKIEKSRGASEGRFDVKVGPGGIRDVEFVAQALQLLYGGRIPELRSRSTFEALGLLGQTGILPRERSEELREAYLFFRRVENRLQMEGERQVHALPLAGPACERLARSCGYDRAAGFLGEIEERRRRVREAVEELLGDGRADLVARILVRAVPDLFAAPSSRSMMEELARQFAHAMESCPDPDRALDNLERFVRGVGRRRFYFELLLDRPELVPRLVWLFASSEYLSAYFATHPQLVEPIFDDPNVLLLDRVQLEESLASIRAELASEGDRGPTEVELDALRQFCHRELINVGLLHLSGKVSSREAERALTEIAEVCVENALALAERELRRRSERSGLPERGAFVVVGMGKLASREMTYGSDLDLVFLYDVPGAGEAELAVAQEHYVRLAQKLLWVLQTRTREGRCYEIDARLRPSGNQGTLVTSIGAFERYHKTSQVWERQALLRARPIAGHRELAHRFERARAEILRRPLPPGAREEIRRIRARMETELAREHATRRDFKTGRGGMQDVETVVQFLQLAHGPRHEELLRVAPLPVHLDTLERLGLLEPEDAAVLREGWRFLAELSHHLRIVENRSISDLEEERGDLDRVARSLGYRVRGREASARRALLEDYRRHTEAIRSVYEKILGGA